MNKTLFYFFILLVFTAFNLMAEEAEFQNLSDETKIEPINVQDDNLRGQAQIENEGLLQPQQKKVPKTTSSKSKTSKKIQEPVVPLEIPPATNESAGFLELKNPFPTKQVGGFWVTALKFESMTPTGRAFVNEGTTYALSDFGAMTKSTISLSYVGQPIELFDLNSKFGVELNFGFSFRDASLLISNDFSIEGRLQSLDLNLQPFWSLPVSLVRNLSFVPFLQAGTAQLALASRNSLARFTYTGNYWGYGLGLDYGVNSNWSLLAEYYSRQSIKTSNPNDWTTTTANYQLGVNYKW